jgi:DNA-binding CsgD family transcriptional regulator
MADAASALRAAFAALHAIGEDCPTPGEFARRGVRELPALVASEITTLSLCDLATGRRRVVSDPPHAFGRAELDAFDRHFRDHPLVRFHTAHHDGGVHRISDAMSATAFRATPLYADYYARVGIDHALALPLYVDDRLLVSFVFNREGRDFTDREREVLGWIAAGKSNAQIAGIVGASPRTVAKHLERIYGKLGVESRTAAAMRAVRR